nr:MAG TPA: hypothetical protein [Bacteriophage sp.]
MIYIINSFIIYLFYFFNLSYMRVFRDYRTTITAMNLV